MITVAPIKAMLNTFNQTAYIPSVVKVAAAPSANMKIQTMAYLLSVMNKPGPHDLTGARQVMSFSETEKNIFLVPGIGDANDRVAPEGTMGAGDTTDLASIRSTQA